MTSDDSPQSAAAPNQPKVSSTDLDAAVPGGVGAQTSAATETTFDDSGPEADSPRTHTRSRKSRRKWYVLATIAMAIIFAPQIAAWLGKGWFTRRLSSETHFDLEFDSLRLSWWGGIKVRGVAVKTPTGVLVAELNELRTQKSAWGLLTAGVEKGKIFIVAPHITLDLSEETLAEVRDSLSRIRVDKGLLRRILQPDRDKHVNFVVVNGWAEIKPRDVDQFQTIARDVSPSLHLTRNGEELTLDIDSGEICQLEVSPTLCDLGLEYVLPVLTSAVDADGVCHLRLHSCHLDLQNLAASEVSGEVFIDSVRAQVDGPLIGQISSFIAEAASLPDGPLILHLTENCPVEFAIADSVVHHEGLKFGLPRVLPSLVLQTRGSIAMDQTIALELEAVLPFEDMGEAPVLQKLGSPSLAVPITGSLSAPKIEVGDGQVVKGLVRDVVKSLTDDQLDPTPLLDQIGEMGLLKRFRQRRASDQPNVTLPSEQPSDSPHHDQVANEDEGVVEEEAESDRPRLLQRIRDRGGLFRRRNRESRGEID